MADEFPGVDYKDDGHDVIAERGMKSDTAESEIRIDYGQYVSERERYDYERERFEFEREQLATHIRINALNAASIAEPKNTVDLLLDAAKVQEFLVNGTVPEITEDRAEP